MFGIISVLGGVGLLCASGVGISSALRWFHNYDFDVTAKMNESKNKKTYKEVGGGDHGKHISNLSKRASEQRHF